jgi:membrane associated rhomboid family serine protease
VFWFVMQVLGALSEVGQTTGTGIAWWAHVGGFTAGMLMVMLSGARPRQKPNPPTY